MVELSTWLLSHQAVVSYYDPLVLDISQSIPYLEDLSKIELDRIHESDLLVIGNPCLSQAEIEEICNKSKSDIYVIDPNASYSHLASIANTRYFSVGMGA